MLRALSAYLPYSALLPREPPPIDIGLRAEMLGRKFCMELLAGVRIILSLDRDVGGDRHVDLLGGRALRGSRWS
jgi:hypothetical protein